MVRAPMGVSERPAGVQLAVEELIYVCVCVCVSRYCEKMERLKKLQEKKEQLQQR